MARRSHGAPFAHVRLGGKAVPSPRPRRLASSGVSAAVVTRPRTRRAAAAATTAAPKPPAGNRWCRRRHRRGTSFRRPSTTPYPPPCARVSIAAVSIAAAAAFDALERAHRRLVELAVVDLKGEAAAVFCAFSSASRAARKGSSCSHVGTDPASSRSLSVCARLRTSPRSSTESSPSARSSGRASSSFKSSLCVADGGVSGSAKRTLRAAADLLSRLAAASPASSVDRAGKTAVAHGPLLDACAPAGLSVRRCRAARGGLPSAVGFCSPSEEAALPMARAAPRPAR